MPMRVDRYGERRQAFGKAPVLLERLLDLLVVERVGGTVDQAPSVSDRGATPTLHQLDDPGLPALGEGGRALDTDRTGVRRETPGRSPAPVPSMRLRSRPGRCTPIVPRNGSGTSRPAPDNGKRFGCRVDRGESTADDDHGQADLEIGDRIALCCAGQLQPHQEIGCGAHAMGETVGKVQHRRPSGTGGDRHMVESKCVGPSTSSVPPKRTPP